MKDFNFSIALAPMIYAFVEHRYKEGYGNPNKFYYLQEFDQLVEKQFNIPIVTKEAIEAWDGLKPYLANRTKIARHNSIRTFAAFTFARDGKSYVPDTSKVRNTTPFTPHIFTAGEINLLIHAADRIPQRKNAPLRELVLPAVFRLLYCCGFRVNEVLRLKKEDIDLDTGVITVKDGKGGKDRFVLLHEDLILYMRIISQSFPMILNGCFFFKRNYSSNAIYENFRELLAGVYRIPAKGQRVPDLRHTFLFIHLSSSSLPDDPWKSCLGWHILDTELRNMLISSFDNCCFPNFLKLDVALPE